MEKGANFELQMELLLHNQPCFLTMTVTPADHLCVEVEQKEDGLCWKGIFSARYIEGITRKTGSFKKFAVFVSMLRSAVLQESESVFVELLSYQDLEMLKHRKPADPGHTPLISNNKRYLILTYDGEFDRVHYPLPLLFDDNPDPDSLKRTVKRQRSEIAHLRSQLRNRAACQAEVFQGVQPNLPSQAKYEEDKQKLVRDLANHKKKCQMLISELQERKNYARDMQALRKRVEALQADLKAERLNQKQSLLLVTKEKLALQDEVRVARIAERRMRAHVQEKENALLILKKQMRLDGESLPVSPASRRPDWSSGTRGSLTSVSPAYGEWPPTSSRSSGRNSSSRRPSPSPYSSRLNSPTPPHQLHPLRNRSKSAFTSRTNSPRHGTIPRLMQDRSKSASSPRSLTPRYRNVDTSALSPRNNASSTANSPAPATTTSNSSRHNYFRYTSPPHVVQRYLPPHSASNSRHPSAVSTRDNSPRAAPQFSSFPCTLPTARGKYPVSKGPSPYDAYLTANSIASASSSPRPSSSRQPASLTSHHTQASSHKLLVRTQTSEPHSSNPSPRIPPRPTRDSSEPAHGHNSYRVPVFDAKPKTQPTPTTRTEQDDCGDAKNARKQSSVEPEPLPPDAAISPRKVLQEVEMRLASYATKEDENNHISHPEVPVPEEEQGMEMQGLDQKIPTNHVTRGAAVLDVDSRLHALQNFLQAAKASMKDEGYNFVL